MVNVQVLIRQQEQLPGHALQHPPFNGILAVRARLHVIPEPNAALLRARDVRRRAVIHQLDDLARAAILRIGCGGDQAYRHAEHQQQADAPSDFHVVTSCLQILFIISLAFRWYNAEPHDEACAQRRFLPPDASRSSSASAQVSRKMPLAVRIDPITPQAAKPYQSVTGKCTPYISSTTV